MKRRNVGWLKRERERKYETVNNSLTTADVTVSSNIIIQMGKHPDTNWILKTKICYILRGHKGSRRLEVFSIYFEGIQGFGKCNRTDSFTRCHYWACIEKGAGCRYFIHVIIILQPPYGPPPITTPLPQYTRRGLSTSIYYKTDNSKMNGQSV